MDPSIQDKIKTLQTQIQLIQQVCTHIRKTPSRFNMQGWILSLEFYERNFGTHSNLYTPLRNMLFVQQRMRSLRQQKDQTTLCIGGWVCHLTNFHLNEHTPTPAIISHICIILNIPLFTACNLLFASSWPLPLQQRYLLAKSLTEQARIACEVIVAILLKPKMKTLQQLHLQSTPSKQPTPEGSP